jgi:GntR family transcriptional regulator
MKLDKHSSLPLYYQLKELIMENIEKNVFAPGSKIPSELELCEELGLSRPTVRQAVSELVSEGQLLIVKGKGTYVSSSSEHCEIKNFNAITFSFLNSQKYNKSEIESYDLVKVVDPELDRLFDQPSIKQDGYIRIRKILGIKAGVFAYIESFIPAALFPNLMSDIKAEKPMVDIIANKYAYVPSKGSCRIWVAPANAVEARALEISKGTPVLQVHSRLVSKSENVTEVVRASLRSDICQLQF